MAPVIPAAPWEQIPTLGLYMDQVLTLLSRYLPFLPRKEKEEQIITTSAINNYVRMKLMPAPEKKKYNRIHIAYLIMICALKQSLTMSEIQKILPNGLTEEEVKKTYEAFVEQYTDSARIFVSIHPRRLHGLQPLRSPHAGNPVLPHEMTKKEHPRGGVLFCQRRDKSEE